MNPVTEFSQAVGSLALVVGGIAWAGHVLLRPWRRLLGRKKQEARAVDDGAGSGLLPQTPEVTAPAEVRPTGVALVLESEVTDLKARLEEAHALESEQYNWAMLAISPFTLLLLAAGIFGGPHVLEVAVFGLLVAVLQVWRWRKAKGEVTKIESVLEDLESQVVGSDPSRRNGS